MKLPLVASTLRRDTGNLPGLRLRNMFAEKTASAEDGYVLQSRPGLNVSSLVGAGPVTAIFSHSGVFSGDVFALSGSQLYRNGASLGAITGSNRISFAGQSAQLIVARGSSIHLYDGATLAAVSFPDDAPVLAVATIGGYFYAIRRDTQRIYFSALLGGDDWQALDFVSAERKPDPALEILNTGEELVVLGPESVEFFQETGDGDAPIARVPGRTVSVGVRATGCAAVIDGSLVWVADDNSVRTYDGTARRLSDSAIDGRISASRNVSAFGWAWEGHVFFAVRLDTETLVVDAATGEWWEAASYGASNWRACCAAEIDGAPVFGDAAGPNLFAWDGWQDAGDPLERVFSAASPLEAPVTVFNAEVTANVGRTDLLAGQGSQPTLEIRASRDAGNTWGAWRPANLGSQGEYRTRTRINRWGMFDPPGMIFEGRVTDPVPLRVSRFGVNEAGGGRSR